MREDFHKIKNEWSEHYRSVTRLEKIIIILLLVFAFSLPISIAGAQFSVGLALILWIAVRYKKPQVAPKIGIRIPLFLFAGYSLLGVAFSLNQMQSLYNARNLLMILIVPLLIRFVRSSAQLIVMLAATISAALITSGIGFFQVITKTAGGHTATRLIGTLGHYMTAGGELMMISLLLIAALIILPRKRYKLAASMLLAVTLLAMLLTQSRNAYIGFAIGLTVALFFWKKWTVALIPILLIIALLLAPASIKDRAMKIFDLEDESIKHRVYMLETGSRIIADFPLFGVGLDQVKYIYNDYKRPFDRGDVPHLHNNFAQIAVERGLPALFFWSWFIIALAYRLWKKIISSESTSLGKVLSIAGLSITAALIFAGLFEYNFGDSEVQMLFWFMIAMPFCEFKKGNSQSI